MQYKDSMPVELKALVSSSSSFSSSASVISREAASKRGSLRQASREHKMSKKGPLFYQSWSGLSRERQVSDSLGPALSHIPLCSHKHAPLCVKAGKEELKIDLHRQVDLPNFRA